MQSLTLFTAILATIAQAAPTPKNALAKRSFTVPRLRNPAYVRDPVKAVTKAYLKYGWDLPFVVPIPDASSGSSGEASSTSSSTGNNDVSAATDSAATIETTDTDTTGDEVGSTSATLSSDQAEYYSPVTIGGQVLQMDFDTGSADLWVFSTDLPSSEIGSHTAFSPSKSSTFETLTGYSFDISYGDGSSASGTVGTDTVSIGDATVTKQAVELATSVSSTFVSDDSSDGLVGLAFSVLNAVSPQPQNTFFENIMSQLEQPVFTANLDIDGSGGYEFGAIDTSKYSGDLTYVPIDNSQGFWQFDSTTYSINGKVAQNTVSSPAIIDTGTSLLLLDDNVVSAYWADVDGAENSSEGWTYPCGATLPDFAVAIGSSYMAKVPGSAMEYSTDGDACYGGLQSNSGNGIQIMGDFALKELFVVFDGGNESIGVADKA